MPLVLCEGNILSASLHELACALVESPEHDVVLHTVESYCQIITVGFQVEKNARTLVELSGYNLETNADLPILKIRDVFGYRIREVRPSLHVVDELFIARAID